MLKRLLVGDYDERLIGRFALPNQYIWAYRLIVFRDEFDKSAPKPVGIETRFAIDSEPGRNENANATGFERALTKGHAELGGLYRNWGCCTEIGRANLLVSRILIISILDAETGFSTAIMRRGSPGGSPSQDYIYGHISLYNLYS
jgi:hypothetical protein